jgi:hypothetical protein
MSEYIVKILMSEFVTHDVKRFIVEKPKGYEFLPGQATKVSINETDWKGKKRPFTFTSLNDDLVLEFTIKGYPEHNGVTERLHQLEPGKEIIIRDPFGTINFQDKGVFIAGGAGVTPFIAILREIKRKGKIQGNRLLFSNKTERDIILEKEFVEMFNEVENYPIFTLTREKKDGYENGRIDKEFLEKEIQDFSQNFYVCGPPPFVRAIKKSLKELGAKTDSIVIEG